RAAGGPATRHGEGRIRCTGGIRNSRGNAGACASGADTRHEVLTYGSVIWSDAGGSDCVGQPRGGAARDTVHGFGFGIEAFGAVSRARAPGDHAAYLPAERCD